MDNNENIHITRLPNVTICKYYIKKYKDILRTSRMGNT